MLKRFTTCVIALFMVIIMTSCSNNNVRSGKMKVVVSFNAMREFAYAIGKDKIDITTIIPDGTEPHDFEIRAKDLVNLSDARLFIYNGLGMEPWAYESVKSVGNKNLIQVEASRGIKPILAAEKGDQSEHSQYDPHMWIGLKEAEIASRNIRDALVKADPSNKDYYEKNYEDFYGKINSLYEEYNEKFKSVSRKDFVTGHDAFSYLCRDYGLKEKSVENVFAEGEPSAKDLKKLIEYCKRNKVKVIFVEDLVSPKVSQTLAKEAGAATLKIHTIESRESGKDYIECMKENLKAIYESLK